MLLLQKIGENYDCLSACEDIDMRDIVATLLDTVPHNPATGLGEILDPDGLFLQIFSMIFNYFLLIQIQHLYPLCPCYTETDLKQENPYPMLLYISGV